MPKYFSKKYIFHSVTNLKFFFVQISAFSSKHVFLKFFLKTIFGNPFLDIYKCPFFIFGNTFGKIILVF